MSDIGWGGLAVSLLLVGVAVALSVWRRLGLEASILWAATRAGLQLLAVGVALGFVLDAGRSIAWAWLWVAVMVLVAADVVRRRAPHVPGLFRIALVAFALAGAVTLGVLFGLSVFELDPRTLIPMGGLMIGNSMAATVLVARVLVDELRDKRDEVEARLALGCSSWDSARPYVRDSLRKALIPQIETTKAVGLVALPGAMTGLILAGVEPFDAVRIQAAVMYLVLAAVATTTAVVALGVTRRLFTPDHRLVALPRSPQN
jgi:UDP-glucose/iron transport system permease protein